MKITFGITGYDVDVNLLHKCLSCVKKQTIKPDRIIVVVSGIPNQYDFLNYNDLMIVDYRLSAGNARNQIMDMCEEEILCFCDIDDEIHPQKCEVIKYIFEQHKPNMVLHNYNKGYNEFFPIDIDKLEVFPITKPNKHGVNLACPIDKDMCHGPIAINLHKIKEHNLRYPDISLGEDGVFCRSVLTNISPSNILYCPEKLINYIKKKKK